MVLAATNKAGGAGAGGCCATGCAGCSAFWPKAAGCNVEVNSDTTTKAIAAGIHLELFFIGSSFLDLC
jgi:hypothetical protein